MPPCASPPPDPRPHQVLASFTAADSPSGNTHGEPEASMVDAANSLTLTLTLTLTLFLTLFLTLTEDGARPLQLVRRTARVRAS